MGRIIVDNARIYLQGWATMSHDTTPRSVAEHGNIVKWEIPLMGWLKLKVDGAVDSVNGIMGFGWVLRNDKGCFKAAVCNQGEELIHLEKMRLLQSEKN